MEEETVVLIAALGVHAVVALAAGLLGRRLGGRVLWLAALAPAVAFAISVSLTPGIADGEVVTASATWVPGLGITLDLVLDGFGLLMWWIISGIGVLVFVYARGYFGDRDDLGRFTAILTTFAGAMLLLTSADSLWVLFIAWEITSITSYLLIGFKDTDPAARASALQALLITAGGGLALMGGLVLITQAAGTASMSAILASPPTGGTVEAGLVLLLLGCMTKSAQVPFHFWLPGAMAAPTPVSAYLHSATMVKAGIYLLARFAPSFGPQVDWWPTTLLVVGGTTMLVGGWRAMTATDAKALLAFGTVSQLGFIVLLVGYGDPEMLFGGVAVLLGHSVFKATLFMTAGIVDHQAHTRDVRRLVGMRSVMPRTFVMAGVATASMAGVLPLLGALAKESGLEGTVHLEQNAALVTGLVIAGSTLTVAYGLRYVTGAFLGAEVDHDRRDLVTPQDVKPPSRLFEAPAVVLTVLTVGLGLAYLQVDAFLDLAYQALLPGGEDFTFKIWHGFGPSLYSSLAALGLGLVVWRGLDVVRAAKRVTGVVPEAAATYRAFLRGLFSSADRTVAIVQPGSLPIYLGIILVTVLLLPGSALLQGPGLELGQLTDSWLQVVVATLIAVSAVGMLFMRSRLSTVLLLGGVGFGVALLFVIQGAPDLALTQLLVETLTLALFVLVLRRLPWGFVAPQWRLGNGLRAAIAASVGVFVSGFALVASSARTAPTSAQQFLDLASPGGGGNNVVNVILTDFRALDTLGEVVVIAIAAIGVIAIATVGRDEQDEVVAAAEPPAGDEPASEPVAGEEVRP